MTQRCFHFHRRAVAGALLASALLAGTAAHAVVGAPASSDTSGIMGDIAYGATGNVFELIPRLFVQGVGGARLPTAITTENPLLEYGFSVSGAGTNLLTIDFSVRNTSPGESFSDLRFMLFANPDGGADFMDVVTEKWSGAAAGDPVRREARMPDALNGILSRIAITNNLTETPSAMDTDCTGGAGCDANVALQWNAALLEPGKTMLVRVGLSDDGQALSSRFLTISSASNAGTALTFSGQVQVVPEPGTTALMLAGLLGVGALVQRRRQAARAG